MSFLSPAQFAFMLWLVAAAAPAAAVLVNGTMLPGEGISGHYREVAVAVMVQSSKSEVQSPREAALTRAGEDFGLRTLGLWTRHEATSVLHTELQRHRPKVA